MTAPDRTPDELRSAERDLWILAYVSSSADAVRNGDQLDRTALAMGQVLTITRESRPRPRHSGDGITFDLDAELPPGPDTAGGQR